MEHTHTTLYQIHTDISLFKIFCDYCGRFNIKNDAISHCDGCTKELHFECDLSEENTRLMMDTIKKHCHYPGEEVENYDNWKESEVHIDFEDILRNYDWWFGTRVQIQYIWSILKKMEGNENVICALRFFKQDYVRAYHDDEY